jgi:hypothetical protein
MNNYSIKTNCKTTCCSSVFVTAILEITAVVAEGTVYNVVVVVVVAAPRNNTLLVTAIIILQNYIIPD